MSEKLSLHRVVVEDLSHLGGPMGTEYTTVIASKWFRTDKGARAWIEEDSKKRGIDIEKERARKGTDNGVVWDCGFVGYTLRKETLEIGD